MESVKHGLTTFARQCWCLQGWLLSEVCESGSEPPHQRPAQTKQVASGTLRGITCVNSKRAREKQSHQIGRIPTRHLLPGQGKVASTQAGVGLTTQLLQRRCGRAAVCTSQMSGHGTGCWSLHANMLAAHPPVYRKSEASTLVRLALRDRPRGRRDPPGPECLYFVDGAPANYLPCG